MQDLEGGTTGQILSKNSNADMDFVWVTNDVGDITEVVASTPLTGGGSSGSVTVGIQDGTTAQKGAVQLEDSTSSTSTTKASTPNSVKSAYDLANAAIPKSLVDAAGDLIYATANDTPARLAIGTAGQVLKVNSGATAPEWGAAGGASGMTLISKTTYSSVASQIVDTVFTSTYTNYMIVIEDWIGSATGLDPRFQLRKGSTTQTAAYYGSSTGYAFNSSTLVKTDSSNAAHFTLHNQIGTGAGTFIVLNISRVGTGSNIDAIWSGHGTCDSNADQYKFGGIVANNDNYTGFVLSTDSGTSSGSVSVYGLAKV
jgi:hypothetical protein